jgi:DnaJ-class molecular chaperone
MSVETQSTSSALPTLETVCPECEGAGSFKDYEDGGRTDCWQCHGAGTIPTEDGKKILALVENNFRRLFRESGI